MLKNRHEEVPLAKHCISVAKWVSALICKELFLRFWKELFGTSVCKMFPSLFSKFNMLVDAKVKKRFLQYCYQLFHIRKLISYSARLTNANHSDIEMLSEKTFKPSLASATSVSPSLSVLCDIAPYHAKGTLSLYGLGLGINSMEARKQKHQKIKYAGYTIIQNKWPMIFSHAFVHEFFLRERGFDEITYTKKPGKYPRHSGWFLLDLWSRNGLGCMSSVRPGWIIWCIF